MKKRTETINQLYSKRLERLWLRTNWMKKKLQELRLSSTRISPRYLTITNKVYTHTTFSLELRTTYSLNMRFLQTTNRKVNLIKKRNMLHLKINSVYKLALVSFRITTSNPQCRDDDYPIFFLANVNIASIKY